MVNLHGLVSTSVYSMSALSVGHHSCKGVAQASRWGELSIGVMLYIVVRALSESHS